ncbi:MAG: MG2 domain-containing protein [Planctomycetota bacterium]
MGRRIAYTAVAFCCVLAGLVTVLTAMAARPAQAADRTNQDLSLVKVTSEAVTVEFYPPDGRPGMLEAELYELGGEMLAKVSREHRGRALRVDLVAQINEEDLANYYLRYRFNSGVEFRRRSLLFVGEILETTVLGQREFVAGTRPVIRILVRDRAAGVPISGASVSVELTHEDRVISKSTARTDSKGEVAAQLDMPNTPLQNAKLKVTVKSKTSTDTVEETIQVRSALRTLLTTDKPLYQPGQTIHIRALTLSQPDMTPLANSEVTFEVEDSKGNKVFKKREETDKFGISHTDFVLANELNMGTYRIRAIAAGMKEEKTVTVERYVLPKFKINFKTDRNFYEPGDTVKGEIQVDYFFGKPVAGGKVEIECAKFDVQYVDFQSIEGKTDKQGHYTFDVRLPKDFVGQPLEAGKASVKFEIKVVDTADHKETITKNVTVTASPIIVVAVPESGELIPDLENKIYIVTTYADSTPARCKVVWTNPQARSAPVLIETDEAGFGEVTVTGPKDAGITMSLTAKDAQGQTGKANVQLKPKKRRDDDSILLRTDKSLYRTGEPLKLSVFSTRTTGNVYIDLIKDRQTYLTRTLELKDGRASDKVTLDATLAGTVQVNAYIIGKNGVIVRDRRLVLVDPADDLTIEVAGDSETYLPASEATLKFKVSNKRGRGVASALGVMVVDEAVFALQEMQPGLEKVYFYLEKEIATPRYEIHGYELDQCISPIPGPGVKPLKARRDTAARVLLASAKGVGDYPLHVNTYHRDNKALALQEKAAGHIMPRYQKIQKAFEKYSKDHRKDKKKLAEGITLEVLVKKGYLEKADTLDPWGEPMKITGRWCQSCQKYHGFVLTSAGIDGKWATVDDVSVPVQVVRQQGQWAGRQGLRAGRAAGVEFLAANGAAGDLVLAEPMAAKALARSAPDALRESVSAAEPIRIRQYFPETLYFEPALITDRRGRATLNVPLADSITTWRLTCMASSAKGQLGSTTAGIRVFQDFFVDIDFPVSLTQNDQVHVPVAIYNYLKTDQKIRLEVKKEDWFELEGLPEKTVTLAPSEVRAVYFPIVAKKIGFQKFTVIARGTKKSDAVARTVEIVPDGKEHLVSHSSRLEGTVTHTITIPGEAIDDASKIFVKIYPGVLSQVIEGLDKMLRMPFGCFEQTSSVTYPNILVLDYMKTAGKITTELQMKAEGFINAGYQRLVSYEVPGGGFEWFGKAPAHRILTAYGLMEFYDMSKVYEVDPAIITRTQQWLAKCQEKDGSYKPSEGGIREGAINKFTDDVLRNTAYITWALASTGYDGAELQKGIDYLRGHLDDMKDVYTRALVVNALATVDAKDDTTLDTLRTLHDMRVEKDDVVYWPAQSETPTHGTGAAADIEVTALAVQAFIRCGRELGTVGKAVTYLVKNKDAYGTWQSTQATIQALRAMLMAERGATATANAAINVKLNGQKVAALTVDENNSDVLQLVDLKDHTREGENTVSLEFEGEGALLYQVVGRYYIPYPRKALPVREEPMSIKLDYDRTQLATDDIIGVAATVTNNRRGKAKMVIVDLGLPPGFTLIPDNLNRLVEDQVIEKYSTTGRQIIVYLREVAHGKPVEIKYQLLAKYPLKAKTPKSVVYEYYNPEVKAETAPVQLLVSKRGR